MNATLDRGSMFDISFIPAPLFALRNEFVKHGFDLRLVGGIVRDTVAGIPAKDIDLCTNATPDQQIALYDSASIRYIPTGLAHGTITVVLDNELFEITSLRIDVETDGRHAKVEFTDDWTLDAQRRDITFNSMSLTFDGELIDPFNGKSDLDNHIVRFVGDADSRIKEDYLRILRWFRFVGRFGTIYNDNFETLESIERNASGLRGISGERIWSEVQRIVSQPKAADLLRAMMDTTVARHINLEPDFGPIDFNHFNVIKEEIDDPVVLIAAWVNFEFNKIKEIADRWKWSVAERKHADWLCNNYTTNADLRRLIAVDNVDRAWVKELAIVQIRDGWEKNALADWIFDPFPVTGEDLIAAGFKPGMQFGIILRNLKNLWADSNYAATKEQLLDQI